MNKTSKTIILSSVLVLALSLALGCIYLVSAETDEEANTTATETPFPMPRCGFCQLYGFDEELKAEMDDTVQAMKDEGASPDEIREYIQGFLEENGVETERPRVSLNSTTVERPELSTEQLELFRQLQEEVNAFAQERAGELGLELPENGFIWSHGMGFRDSMRGHGFREHPDN